ncbi:unnamed protein product [Urochloa decumbens]|uniref:NAC domain-containing protein n=1 Tax=Urochloa decumbens TaxID=240449 RepID=A0ABC8YEV5_9POAL
MAAADHPGPGGWGCAASPTDHDLITFVLRPMAEAAAGQGQHQGFDGGFVHLADVYTAAPESLADRYAPAPGTASGAGAGGEIWYFLCPARCRYRAAAAAAGALGQGCWAAASSETTGAARAVTGPDGRRVGQARALSYSCGGSRAAAAPPWAAVTRHGWCMVELAVDEHDGIGGAAGGFVLCKLFRSPRNEAPSTAVPALASSCKRKAAVEDHPDAPPGVRQQLVQRSY